MAVIAVHLLVVPPVTAGQGSVYAGEETARERFLKKVFGFVDPIWQFE